MKRKTAKIGIVVSDEFSNRIIAKCKQSQICGNLGFNV
jgi:hypothetical protein